jgi:hypothetical protein
MRIRHKLLGGILSHQVSKTSASETKDHRLLLLSLPALASLLFCFSYILMDHPASRPASKAAAAAHQSPLLTTAPSSLPSLQLQDESPLPVVSADGSDLSASFDSLNTTSPQPGNGYGRSNSLSSSNNSQAASNSQSLLNNLGSSLNGVLNSTKN